ncbi:hypothetical protein HII31_06496 [Pseudocercospora fuligena]|uniref:F-box domain-containing protein n=1 Tax=Pseudocercospora fuligena TaxID=685502 RepID=A0A8H6VMG5_9PEZI|nr:hypothetical protein HII31_06496 [Pseudocercospora fuligena]
MASSTQICHIDSLPAELLDCIISWLPVEGLISARDVCSSWRRLIDQDPEIYDQLFLRPQKAEHFAKSIASAEGRSLHVFDDPGDAAEDSHYADAVPLGLVNTACFEAGVDVDGRAGMSITEYLLEIMQSSQILRFVRDPRPEPGVYNPELWREMYITQPPISRVEYFCSPIGEVEETDDGCINGYIEVEEEGIRVRDVIAKIESLESELGGEFEWQDACLRVEGRLLLSSKAELRQLRTRSQACTKCAAAYKQR